MVQAQDRSAQVDAGRTIEFTTAPNPAPKVALSSSKDAAFARLWAAVGIADPAERLAALEGIAEAVQLTANAKARATWRGYSLWRAPLDGQTRILGLFTPDKKRYRARKSMVSPSVWLWEGNPFMGYLNALNLQLRRAGSNVQVQSKHVLITWFLREAEKWVEAGVESVGVCPLCGGDLFKVVVYVGGRGDRTVTQCWHEEQGCNDWLVRRGRL